MEMMSKFLKMMMATIADEDHDHHDYEEEEAENDYDVAYGDEEEEDNDDGASDDEDDHNDDDDSDDGTFLVPGECFPWLVPLLQMFSRMVPDFVLFAEKCRYTDA